MQNDLVLSPAEFISSVNQTLEFAYPIVVIEGELSNFKVAKNRWVYFDLKDEEASVRFFGTIYSLPGPLEDGITVRATGSPRMHSRFGFSVNFRSILPVGEGALKKASDLLFKKLEGEGLFALERKRALPYIPETVGLITAGGSAAAADFNKILNERWSGVEILLADVYVQGDQAPIQIVQAIDYFNQMSEVPEILVITRGGGSAEDLSAFNDERLVRAVASSRIPTLVAIGHEVDTSLAELAADQRASTPSNAAQILVPDKTHEQAVLKNAKMNLKQALDSLHKSLIQSLITDQEYLKSHLNNIFSAQKERLNASRRLVKLYDPKAALSRGYALININGKHLKSVRPVKVKNLLSVQLVDGTIKAEVQRVDFNG
jgi:exodeoxyribonuclease VII large subunit